MASIRERKSDSGKVSYTVTWRDADGKQRGETVGSRREALKLKQRAEEAGKDSNRERYVREGKKPMGVSLHGDTVTLYDGPKPADRHGKLTIAGYAETFLETHRYSDTTRRVARQHIKKHLVPAFEHKGMAYVTRADVTRFIRKLEAAGMTGATIQRVCSFASAMWATALNDEIVTGNPWLSRKDQIPQHEARVKQTMLPQQFHTICAEIEQPSYNLLVRTLGQSGLRWSEAERLMPGDVTGDVLHVRKSKSRAGQRKVRINPELADELRASLPFRSPTGKTLSYRDFRRTWDKAVEGMLCGAGCRAQCELHPRIPFTPHDLRHGFCTWALAGGASLVEVRDAAGHSDINTTSGYLHALNNDGVLNALSKLLSGAA